jgi:hypothetical protein
VFEDESGQGLRPPKGRTWGRRGTTPVVTVTGGSNGRVSLAALIAVRDGHRPPAGLPGPRRPARDKRKGFTETGYARLLDAAHQQLGGPPSGCLGQCEHAYQQGDARADRGPALADGLSAPAPRLQPQPGRVGVVAAETVSAALLRQAVMRS